MLGSPRVRNALRGALKREIKIQRILTPMFYVTQILILYHTETTEITERYMSHGNHGSHRKIYFCEILKPVVSYAKRIISVISVISV